MPNLIKRPIDTLQPQLLAQAEHLQISIEPFILQAIHQQLTQTSSTTDSLSLTPQVQLPDRYVCKRDGRVR